MGVVSDGCRLPLIYVPVYVVRTVLTVFLSLDLLTLPHYLLHTFFQVVSFLHGSMCPGSRSSAVTLFVVALFCKQKKCECNYVQDCPHHIFTTFLTVGVRFAAVRWAQQVMSIKWREWGWCFLLCTIAFQCWRNKCDGLCSWRKYKKKTGNEESKVLKMLLQSLYFMPWRQVLDKMQLKLNKQILNNSQEQRESIREGCDRINGSRTNYPNTEIRDLNGALHRQGTG